MTRKLSKAFVLAFIAFTAGLILQCASDPQVTGDGGLLDVLLSDAGLKDGVGPKADAATGGAKRTVFKGKLDSKGQFKVCGKWTLDDPPMVGVWTGNASHMWLNREKQTSDEIQMDSKGCLSFSDITPSSANSDYRVVVIH